MNRIEGSVPILHQAQILGAPYDGFARAISGLAAETGTATTSRKPAEWKEPAGSYLGERFLIGWS